MGKLDPGAAPGDGEHRGGAALVFAVALLASGVSSGVGTFAGEVIMAGFIKLRVPRLARRAVTMTPH
jgi:manganese transport protein